MIYEKISQYDWLESQLDGEDGTTLEATLEALRADLIGAGEWAACKVKELNAMAYAIREEEKALAARRQAHERKADKLKEIVQEILKRTNSGVIETAKVKAKLRKCPVSVDVFNQNGIPDEYWVPQEPKLDKRKLLDEMKAGVIVDGAKLIEDKLTVEIV